MKTACLSLIATVSLLALCGAAMAEPPAAPATRSRQAIFDEGQAAFDARNWDKAITDFSQVLAGVPVQHRSDGVIRVRLADALIYAGRLDEAEDNARQAIAVLKPFASGADADLADAYLALADALRLDLAYGEAAVDFRLAQNAAAGPNAADQILEAEIGTAQVTMVTDPDVASASLDAILADHAFATQPKQWQAQMYSLRARAELNRGDPSTARTYVEKALALQGGVEKSTVSLAEVGVRGDAALIYSVLHQDEKTRRYLTYTGAGHLPDVTWFDSAVTEPPVCGPDIAPEDRAVVEFSIADDGRTAGAAPVWASRPGRAGVAIAEAVRDWRWRPEAAAKLDGFWRESIRVELRCATKPPALTLAQPFKAATEHWLLSRGDTEPLTVLAAQHGPGVAPSADLARITALFRQVSGASVPPVRNTAELDALLVKENAPTEARALASFYATHDFRGSLRSSSAARANALGSVLSRFDEAPGGQRSAAWLRVEMAVALETAGQFAAARPPLEAVVALPPAALPGDDPIRNVAVLHLSMLDRKFGDPVAAQARLNASGMTVQKCDLLDVKPVPTNLSTSGSDFPREAARWNFEGWVVASFDIAPDGRVKDVRAIISYPPFIFSEATEAVVSHFRYLPPVLGDTALGCTGETAHVNYRLMK